MADRPAPTSDTTEGHDTFDADWLTLREPADHRARPPALVERLAARGEARGWSRVLDLGCGRGSNLRYLRPRLPWAEDWIAVDHDPAHVSDVERAFDGGVRAVEGDLRREGLSEMEGRDLVTASALLDLVTVEWVGEFAARAASEACAVLLALTWDGTAEWSSPEEGDEAVLAAVRRHQRGKKGMGTALGPDAVDVAAAALRASGLDVTLAASPWRLEGERDAMLAEQLVRGWVTAATEVRPSARRDFETWLDRRLASIRRGRYLLRVGHSDILALPGAEGEP